MTDGQDTHITALAQPVQQEIQERASKDIVK